MTAALGSRNWRVLGGPLLARISTLPISIFCGLASVRLIVGEVGAADYGIVALLFSVQLILPFMDLGTGAAVLNGAARFRVSRNIADLAGPLGSALKVTVSMSLGALLVTTIVAAFDLWSELLGQAGDGRLGIALVLIMGLNLVCRPLTLALTAMIGIGLSSRVVFIQALGPIAALCFTAVAVALDADVQILGAGLVTGQAVAALVATVTIVHSVPGLPGALIKGVRPPGLRVASFAGPMFVINLVAPLGAGLDRLILSHRSSLEELAIFALVAQIVQPAGSLVSVVQQTLWGEYARRRSMAEKGLPRLVTIVAGVLFVSAAVGVPVMYFIGPTLASYVSDGGINVPGSVFVLLVAAWSLQMGNASPSAFLTDARGLRAQAALVCLAVGASLSITVAFAPTLGAHAAALGTLCGALILLAGAMSLSWILRTDETPDGRYK